MESLHPAPVEGRRDWDESSNRKQLDSGDDRQAVWWRAVEVVAADLQVDPVCADGLLRSACDATHRGMAWDRYPVGHQLVTSAQDNAVRSGE